MFELTVATSGCTQHPPCRLQLTNQVTNLHGLIVTQAGRERPSAPRKGDQYATRWVDFERAAEVFRDPLALTIPDDEHSISEVRWITMGRDTRARPILVVHTFEQLDDGVARIRIISARRPTRTEARDYEEQQ